MGQKQIAKTDVIFVGLGGMGVLMAGKLLSTAALNQYKYVSWLPSYGVEKRGGLCECTVVYSDKEISSPIIDQAKAVIAIDNSQFNVFENRVKPGGMYVVESSGLQEERKRTDYQLLKVAGREAAIDLGDIQLCSLVLLGAFAEASDTVQADSVEKELKSRFSSNETVLERNLNAFKKGVELGTAQ